MYSDNELLIRRDIFQVETEIVMLQLNELLEKTKKLENQLTNEKISSVSVNDFYKPTPDIEYPPRKRAKR